MKMQGQPFNVVPQTLCGITSGRPSINANTTHSKPITVSISG